MNEAATNENERSSNLYSEKVKKEGKEKGEKSKRKKSKPSPEEDLEKEKKEAILAMEAKHTGLPEQEFAVVTAMRNVDLIDAKQRALKFAKRLWDNRTIPKHMQVLCKAKLMMPLMKWYLQSISKRLVPYPTLKEQADQASIHEKSVNDLKKLKIELNIINYKKYNSKNKRIQNEIIDINIELDNLSKSIDKQKKLKNKINNNLGESISLGSLYKDTSNKVLNNAEKIKNIAQIANERIDNLERSEIQFKNDIKNKKMKILNNSNLVSSLSVQLINKKNILKDETNELEINLNPKITQYSLNKKVYPQGRSKMGMPGTKPRKSIKKWKPKK